MTSRRVLHLLVSFSLLFQSSLSLSFSEVNVPIVKAINAQAVTVFASPLATPMPQPLPQATIVPPPISVAAAEIAVDARGGRLASADRRVQLDVPPGLFQRNTRLRISPPAEAATTVPAGARVQFELTARDVASDTLIVEFAQPVTITVDLNGVVDRTQLQPSEHLALFHETGNPDAPWAEVIDAVEIQPGVLQARLQHFSALASGSSGDAPAGWHLKYNPPVVSTFSGAATFNYPIEAGPGRNGLQPSIVLGYSSRSVDGVVNIDTEDSDGVPFGWALDLASINRDGTEVKQHYGWSTPATTLDLYSRFSLAINGANYQLMPKDPNQKFGQYYAKDAPGLYVERRNDAGWNGTTTNTSHEYWVVKTGDGTTYRFGYNSDAEQTQGMVPAHLLQCLDGGYCGATYGTAAVRWRVDRIADTFGNVVTMTYQTKSTEQSWSPLAGTLQAEHTRPAEIKYNFNSGVAASRVVFSNSSDNTYNWINRISVYHAGEGNKVREYQLGWDSALLRMTAITQTNATGTQWLPPTTFVHQDLSHGNQGQVAPYITRIDNGYGGATEISYLNDWRHESISNTLLFGYSYRVQEVRTYDGINPAPAKVRYDYGTPCYDESYTYVPGTVFCRGTYPQTFGPLVGHQVVTQTAYAYGGTTIAARTVYSYSIADNNSPFRGREMWSKAYDGGNVLAYNASSYVTMTVNNTIFTYLRQQDQTTSDNAVLATTTVSYTYDLYGNVLKEYEIGDPTTTGDERLTETMYNPITTVTNIPQVQYWGIGSSATSTNSSTRTRAYDQNPSTYWQSRCYNNPSNNPQWIAVWFSGGAQPVDVIKFKGPYNPQVFEVQYDSGGQWTTMPYTWVADGSDEVTVRLNTQVTTSGILLRATRMGSNGSQYCFAVSELRYGQSPATNTGQWIVNKPATVDVYAGVTPDGAGVTLMSQVRNTYDNQASHTYSPMQGALTRVERGGPIGPWVSSGTSYDAFGNPIVITDTRQYTTTTVYDTAYRLYPVQVSNALGQSTWTQFDYGLSMPITVTDANGSATSFRYDTFGRLTKVIRPGDSEALPTTEYRYAMPNGDVHGLQTYQREVSGLGSTDPNQPYVGTVVSVDWFDGLGRTYQTRREGAEPNVMIVQDLFYDALGRTITQSVPYSTTNGGRYATSPDLTQPRSLTHYDALGRADVITNTDGTTVTTQFKGRQTAVRDAKGHLRISEADAFGRLSTMREYTQTIGAVVPGTFDLPAYATTRYTYDAVGNLKVVTDAQNNITTIYYDALGRKTEMYDPDMGHWTYQYDPAGNLITQTDALNQVLWFNYDPLSRLTEKRQTGSGGNLLAKYTYGSAAPNIGYRLRMDDLSGYTTWTYDNRGRMTQETKAITINNTANVFVTGLGYDALDRVITTTYPTGEVVTQTYNAMGTLENVRSASSAAPYANQWYVKNLDYNAPGALTLVQVGNNVTTNYTYDPLSFRLKTLNVSGLYLLQYGYDNVGNVLSWTSLYTLPTALTESIQYQYDALDRLTHAISVTNGYSGTYAYDKIGNIKTTTPLGTYFYEADSRGLNCAAGTQEIKPHAVSEAGNNTYRYDCNGNMTSRVENNVTYQQQWDVENRLTVVTNTNTLSVTRFIYDGDGARVLQLQPDGYQTAYVGNLMELKIAPTSALPQTGWRGRVTRQEGGVGLSSVNLSLAKREVCSGNGTLQATLSYGGGGMLGTAAAGQDTGTLYIYRADASFVGTYNTTLIYNIPTETYIGALSVSLPPGSYQVYAQTVVGGVTSYSSLSAVAVNALQTASVWLVAWASRAPLVQAVTPLPYSTTLTTDTPLGSTTTNVNGDYALVVTGITYNGGCSNSLRLTENVLPAFTAISASAPAPGVVLDATTIQYPAVSSGDYANNHFVQSSATAPLSGPEVKSYYFAGSQLIAVRTQIGSASTLHFLHSDHLGSTSLTTDQSGNAVARQLYDAWGNIRASASSGTMPTDIGYTGQRLDATGLMYYRARYYDPSLNRFISADTMVPSPSNPQQLNRFTYGLNNPVKFIDPSGYFTQCAATDSGYRCWDDGYSIDNPWNTSSDADTRRAWLLDYANNLATWARNGWLTDLDALGQLSDFAVSLIPGGASNRTVAYVNDMSSVLIGAEGVNVLLKSLTAGYDAPNFGDTGFHRDYQDRQNQLYHFWAYVTTIANGNNLGGWFMGITGNGGHEMLDPGEAFRKLKTGDSGMSWEDYCLALAGMSLGQKLATGAVSIEQADDWMRGALSTEYPGKIDDSWRATGTEWWPSKIWERAVTTAAQVIYIDWYYYMPK